MKMKNNHDHILIQYYRKAFYRPFLDDTLIYQNNSQLTSGEMNTLATAYKACSGHGKNQSILALFTIPKNDSIIQENCCCIDNLLTNEKVKLSFYEVLFTLKQ